MIEGITTHCKVVTIGINQSSAITLNAANGSAINCNFLELSVSDAGGAGYMLIVPSGVSQIVTASGNVLPPGNSASGTYGYLLDTKETHRISLGHGRKCTGVTVYNYSAAAKTLLLTYGITTVNNPINKGNANPYI